MDRSALPTDTVTRALRDLDKDTGNIFETVAIISKRADVLSAERKDEILNRLSDFISTTDSLEETFENREQIEMSRYFERLPKPAIVATEEFLAGRLKYRYKDQDESKVDNTQE